MRAFHPLVLTAGILTFCACRTDEPVDPDGPSARVRIEVIPEWHEQPLQTFTPYPVPYGRRFQVEVLKLYLSDIRLVDTAGIESIVDEVELLDLGQGRTQIELQAPEGRWNGMRAGIGMPHALNYSNPALYAADHPLSVNTGMYWTWASGYKFVLFDGRSDPDANGSGPLLMPFSIHTGRDTCFTTVDLFPALPFATEMGGSVSFSLHVAVDRFISTPQDSLDVITENMSHGNDIPLALKLTRNVKRSFHLVQE